MASLWNKNNPWAGLSSYPDPEKEETSLKFCGRDNESFDVTRLIDNNIFVTLYGRSGTGKTSLLNAGIFPRLRQEHYFPVSIRLGMEGRETGFQQSILSRVTGDLQKAGGSVLTRDVIPLGQDEQTPEYLWRFFARSQFLAKEGHVVFPVIVLDQFEEVLHRQTTAAEVLLRQIHFMMDESHALPDSVVDGAPYVYDFNFRFVISIREDDLYRLEDSIDNNFLPEMKSCRFRLRNLSEQGGREAILIPGENLFRSDERDKVADTILSLARSKQDNSINANILSLICSRIFVEYQRSGANEISLDLVDKFIRSNPFEALYHEATAGLSRREKNYIETHLVDSEGRRDSIPESDFFRHVKNGGQLFSGDTKILQRTFVSSDENRCRIELVHDSFCEPLSRLKEKREKMKHRKELLLGIAIGLIGLSLGSFMYWQNKQLKTAQAKASAQAWEILQKNNKLESINTQIEAARQATEAKNKELEKTKQDLERQNRQLLAATERAKRETERADRETKRADRAEEMLQAGRIKSDDYTEEEASKLRLSTETPSLIEFPVDSAFSVDGILYETDTPDDAFISAWKQRYASTCRKKIPALSQGYSIQNDMIDDDPCLVYLVLNSRSISDPKERQSWFDLYSLMNEEQITKLYNILYRETYKLAAIEDRYQKRQQEIAAKYNTTYEELLSEYEQVRRLWLDGQPGQDSSSFEKTQDQILDITENRFGYGEQLEKLLLPAIDDYERLYRSDASYKNRLIALRKRLGELYSRQSRNTEALEVFQKNYALDPKRSAANLATASNNASYDYALKQDFDKAFELVDKAIALRPDRANYYDTKGEFYLMLGDVDNALKMWKKVIELDPGFLSKNDGHTNLYDGLKQRGLL